VLAATSARSARVRQLPSNVSAMRCRYERHRVYGKVAMVIIAPAPLVVPYSCRRPRKKWAEGFFEKLNATNTWRRHLSAWCELAPGGHQPMRGWSSAVSVGWRISRLLFLFAGPRGRGLPIVLAESSQCVDPVVVERRRSSPYQLRRCRSRQRDGAVAGCARRPSQAVCGDEAADSVSMSCHGLSTIVSRTIIRRCGSAMLVSRIRPPGR